MRKRTLPEAVPEHGEHLALRLDLTLGPSTCGNMVFPLREVGKAETGSKHQKGLTKVTMAKQKVDQEIAEAVKDASASAMQEDQIGQC